jgi:multidrug efflux pump subunit AcrA (membrane-fusion protein)
MNIAIFFGTKVTRRQKMTRWLSFGLVSALAGTASFASYHLLFAASQAVPVGQESAPLTDSAKSNEEGALSADTAEPITVAVAPLSSFKPAVVPTRVTGIVAAARTSQLSAKQLGRVEKVHVDIGDKVQAGQVLVELDMGPLRAERKVLEANLSAAEALLTELKQGPREQEIAQAKTRVDEADANLKYREAMLKRSEQLKISKTISQQEFDESYTAFLVAQAQLESQRKSLDLMVEGTRKEQILGQEAAVAGLNAQIAKVDVHLGEQRIVAPFEGRIQKRLIDEGTVVNPGVAILEIVEDEAKEIRVGVPTEIAEQLSIMDVRLCLAGEVVRGEVVRIAPAIDERTRKIEVVLRPQAAPSVSAVVSTKYDDNTSSKKTAGSAWLIGSAVTVEVRKGGIESGLWVPAQCLTSGTRGLWSVYLATPQLDEAGGEISRVQRCEVEVLRNAGDWVEIRGPLKGDERLVVSGIHRLTHGQLVRAEQQLVSVPTNLDAE